MKKYSILLGASLLTGLLGSLLLRKEKQSIGVQKSFIGTWAYTSLTGELVSLAISSDYELEINRQKQKTSMVELTPERLVLLDSMGYQLLFEQKDGHTVFYDEADDRKYLLTKTLE